MLRIAKLWIILSSGNSRYVPLYRWGASFSVSGDITDRGYTKSGNDNAIIGDFRSCKPSAGSLYRNNLRLVPLIEWKYLGAVALNRYLGALLRSFSPCQNIRSLHPFWRRRFHKETAMRSVILHGIACSCTCTYIVSTQNGQIMKRNQTLHDPTLALHGWVSLGLRHYPLLGQVQTLGIEV